LIIICENENNNLLNNVLIADSHDIVDIVIYINEYFYRDNISDEVFKTKVNDLTNKMNSNQLNKTNFNDPTYVIYK
jgi:hypothetical protein